MPFGSRVQYTRRAVLPFILGCIISRMGVEMAWRLSENAPRKSQPRSNDLSMFGYCYVLYLACSRSPGVPLSGMRLLCNVTQRKRVDGIRERARGAR